MKIQLGFMRSIQMRTNMPEGMVATGITFKYYKRPWLLDVEDNLIEESANGTNRWLFSPPWVCTVPIHVYQMKFHITVGDVEATLVSDPIIQPVEVLFNDLPLDYEGLTNFST
jgi:hypothetical protein